MPTAVQLRMGQELIRQRNRRGERLYVNPFKLTAWLLVLVLLALWLLPKYLAYLDIERAKAMIEIERMRGKK